MAFCYKPERKVVPTSRDKHPRGIFVVIFQVISKQCLKSKVWKGQELKQSEPNSSPQNQKRNN